MMPIDKHINQMLNTPPAYKKFNIKNKVFAVSMREELVLKSTNMAEFIGTYGMGPCIGIAIIAKKDNIVKRVGLAHIDAMTDLNSLGIFLSKIGTADVFDVVIMSSGNDRKRAIEILKYILLYQDKKIKINVMSKLDGSTSFAINTLTGDVYQDIPPESFLQDHKLNDSDILRLDSQGPLIMSPLYDEQKRKTAKEITLGFTTKQKLDLLCSEKNGR